MDRYLRKVLLSWSTHKQPPQNGRARLLLVAATQTFPEEEPVHFFFDGKEPRLPDLFSLHTTQPSRNFDLMLVFHMPMPGWRMV